MVRLAGTPKTAAPRDQAFTPTGPGRCVAQGG
jgi:hypothetical protein